jgi:hypothetical protein
MTMGGFGPPWVLFAVFAAAGVYFDPDGLGETVQTAAYFYAVVCTSFLVAGARTAVIVSITLERERYVAQHPGASPADLSHHRYWWSSRATLLLSSLFVLGDGMGRIWAVVSAIDALFFLYVKASPQPLSVEWYFVTSLCLAGLSGIVRLLWWNWYWFTLVENARAQQDDDGAGSTPKAAPVAAADAGEPASDDDGGVGGAVRDLLRGMYPTVAYNLPPWLRYSVRRAYAFLDGFGRTYAFFAVINFIVDFYDPTTTLLQVSAPYFWLTILLCLFGGLFTAVGPGFPRYKVFLHEDDPTLKRHGSRYVRQEL